MVSRLDLDGTYSPHGLVTKILSAEPNLRIPVPIEELAHQLDIAEINELATEGFLGGLLTNPQRSFGSILVSANLQRTRRRFTIAHELGHFLIPYHTPQEEGQFLCDKKALGQLDTKSRNQFYRMEAEANQFASLLLMPPPRLRPLIDGKRFPSLETVLEIHQTFDVSKYAAARAYIEYNSECLALLVARHGKIQAIYKTRDFPRLAIAAGDPIPNNSLALSRFSPGALSDSDPADMHEWFDIDELSRVRGLYEQVLGQANGFSMIQLKALMGDPDEYDPEADMTSKERLAYRRW
ncbi:ImmA/IrrE family metallo-endopeptidase [Glycocaulis albus]|uniref:ImmA/IrrE family metallo-endopeptidase n=1 Tax=Glycocaulis albus TaxID=1382801 RepID=UPI0016663EE5|nr:ImmA/IrrE family metallo-endopeptidase [Glycocaulis albus]